MNTELDKRLNKILPRLESEDFLKSTGLGNEIAFYIFEYPAEEEIHVRKHIEFVINRLKQRRPELRIIHINLFNMIICKVLYNFFRFIFCNPII